MYYLLFSFFTFSVELLSAKHPIFKPKAGLKPLKPLLSVHCAYKFWEVSHHEGVMSSAMLLISFLHFI